MSNGRSRREPHAIQQGPMPWRQAPDLRALAEAIPASYRGPWRWHGYTSGPISLATVHNGVKWVMRFTRLGMSDAQPMFPEPDAEDQAWFADPHSGACGHMVKASERTVQEVHYREDVVDIDNPMARWLAAATPNRVLALLACADALREWIALGNQQGMDDDEMDAAMDRAEAAIAALDGAS